MSKIISMHIMGYSVRDIGDKLNIGKSTAQEYIDRWRRYEIAPFREGVSVEDETIEVARYMKENHLSIEDLRDAITLHGILRDLGADQVLVISLVNVIKETDQPENTIRELLAATSELMKEDLGPAKLLDEVHSLNRQKKEKTQLLNDIRKEHSKVQLEASKTKSENAKLEQLSFELKGTIKEREKQIQEMDKLLKTKQKVVDTAENFKDFVRKEGLDSEQVIKFSQNAAQLGYNAKYLASMKYLNIIGNKEKMTPEDLESLVSEMNFLSGIGFNARGIREVFTKLKEQGMKDGDLNREFKNFLDDMQEKNKQVKLLDERIDSQRSEHKATAERFEAERKGFEAEIRHLNGKLTVLQGSSWVEQSRLSEISDKVKEKNKELKNIEKQTEVALSDHGYLMTAIEAADDLHDKMAESNLHLNQLNDEETTMNAKLLDLQGKMNALSDDLKLAQRFSSILDSDLNTVTTSNPSIRLVPDTEVKNSSDAAKLLIDIAAKHYFVLANKGVPEGWIERSLLDSLVRDRQALEKAEKHLKSLQGDIYESVLKIVSNGQRYPDWFREPLSKAAAKIVSEKFSEDGQKIGSEILKGGFFKAISGQQVHLNDVFWVNHHEHGSTSILKAKISVYSLAKSLADGEESVESIDPQTIKIPVCEAIVSMVRQGITLPRVSQMKPVLHISTN